uniref:Ig-like domain-containing protein n=1 Tax=Oryzias latipes TaxID=8090 RepID=A0A3P9HWY0_ORYLA
MLLYLFLLLSHILGKSVTMKCNYQTSSRGINLNWFKHDSDLQVPQFILWKGSSSSPQFLIKEYSEETEKVSVKHDKEQKEFRVKISSAAVTDSAVYYCAVRPTVTGNNKTLYKILQSTRRQQPAQKTQHYTISTRGNEAVKIRDRAAMEEQLIYLFTPPFLHVFNTYSLCHFTLLHITSFMDINVWISFYVSIRNLFLREMLTCSILIFPAVLGILWSVAFYMDGRHLETIHIVQSKLLLASDPAVTAQLLPIL